VTDHRVASPALIVIGEVAARGSDVAMTNLAESVL
jgi:hypothetical protein